MNHTIELNMFEETTISQLQEPRCEKTGLRGVPTRSDKSRAAQKIARDFKFRI